MSQITTHVLDTSAGKPAKGIEIKFFKSENSVWNEVAKGVTNDDGRISDLLEEGISLERGIYKMHFRTEEYYKEKKTKSFYPFVEIVFIIDSDEHYHIPLLLNPFGYTTYRGQ